MQKTWILAAVIFTASTATASPETHDGIYLRLQTGLGYTSASNDAFTLKGGSGGLNVELGFALFRNFIIAGKLFGTTTPSPDLKIGGVTFENDDEDLRSNFGAAGVGLTYYIMPANVYLSGALTVTKLGLVRNDENLGETKTGQGLHFGIGKEWWLADEWGLGLGAELALARVPDESDTTWKAVSALVLLSVTYN
ncbi:outer membrane beta-barrel protein [Hyalangium versicolor]|uniref:outer membrane beta-barrel protein n=1 Tax=Hyalangium versicolor TaxID=2861190 RepID=UPI001CCC8AE9|nr:outer membrane beta-barrel protein [Hyalangium versicolor]